MTTQSYTNSYSGASVRNNLGIVKRGYILLLIVLLISVFLILLLVSLFFVKHSNPESVPYNLHSILRADYSADPLGMMVPVIQFGLIQEVIHDLGTPNSQVHYATLQAGLRTLVPTVTSMLPMQATNTPTLELRTPTSTGTEIYPVATLPDSTVTPQGTDYLSATIPWQQTATSTFIPTRTPISAQTTVPSATYLPPTQPLSSPTARPSAQPSPTLVQPTETNPPPTPTQSPPTPTQPLPTPTQPPPTPTQPPPTPTSPPYPPPPYP